MCVNPASSATDRSWARRFLAALRGSARCWLTQAPRRSLHHRMMRRAPQAIRRRRYLAVQAPTALPRRQRLGCREHRWTAIIRVALIGAIGDHKGYRVLLDCARRCASASLSAGIIVIGYTYHDAPLLKTAKCSSPASMGRRGVAFTATRTAGHGVLAVAVAGNLVLCVG